MHQRLPNSFQKSLRNIYLSCFTLVVGLSGCGSSLVEVSGVVTVDGQPTPGVNLRFFPQGTQADAAPSSTTSVEGGKFSLITDAESGVAKGSYKVNADWPDPDHKPKKIGMFGEPSSPSDKLKGKYVSNSDITVQIDGPKSDLEISLKTK